MLERVIRIRRVTPTFNPSERAMSSPRLSMFKWRENHIETRTAAAIPIHGIMIAFEVIPLSVPIIKVVILIVMSLSINFIVLIPALNKEEIVIPARIIVVLELSPRYAIPNTRNVVIKAPANAKTAECDELPL